MTQHSPSWTRIETRPNRRVFFFHFTKNKFKTLRFSVDATKRYGYSEYIKKALAQTRRKEMTKQYPTVKDMHGDEIDWEAVAMMMDSELREQLNGEIDWDVYENPDQAFFEKYAEMHEAKFGQEFVCWVGGAW